MEGSGVTLPIFVINLPESTTRRDRTQKNLDELGLSAEFFPAVRGASLTPAELSAQYNPDGFFRPLSSGEIGCALSHISIYRRIVEENLDCALILEDDVHLPKELVPVLRSLSGMIKPGAPEIILLTQLKEFSGNRAENIVGPYRLVPVIRAGCAHGYIVTNAGARALLKEFYPIRKPADWWEIAQEFITLRGVDPYLIGWDTMATGSTLAPTRDSLRKQRKTAGYFYKKLSNRIRARVLWWTLRLEHGVFLRWIMKRTLSHH